MPTKQIKNILRKFFELEYAGGLMMIISAAAAMLLANSGAAGVYKDLRESSVTFQLGLDFFTFDTAHFVNNGLMALFFLLVGLELKHEMVEGELKTKKQIMLPLFAALGGMVVPALVYVFVNGGVPANFNGWGIPAATDIAFAVCILTVFGRKIIPPSARIFLLAVAIFDDIGAIIIIAFYFSHGFDIAYFVAALLLGYFMFRLNRITSPNLWHYLVLGAALSYLLHMAGIHATIGGVITGLAVPKPMLKKFIAKLHPVTTYFVLPLFAFISAGVALDGASLDMATDPLPLGIALGLFVGKQIGIFGTVMLLVKLNFAPRPQGMNWGHMYVVSILAGIGFTMSLFIGMLAFPNKETAELVKLGVIMGSVLSVVYGVAVMRLIAKK